MTTTPDTLVVSGPLNQQITLDNAYVTPTGGSQQTLAAALAAAGGSGGPISATTLTASSTVTLSPASKNVTISPTGTGTVTIDPATAGAMDNIVIGGTTAVAGTFAAVVCTTLAPTSTVTLSPANKDVVISPSGTGKVTMAPVGASTMDNVAIGGTTPLAGKFTTVAYTTDNGLTLTNQTSGAAAQTGTLTNAPTAGNPAIWLKVVINGTNSFIPCWH